VPPTSRSDEIIMKRKDETQEFFAGTEGCLEHGEDAIQVCPNCGEEFCSRCSPGALCPDCGLVGEEDEDEVFGAPAVEGADEEEDVPDDVRDELDDD
jgi:hypothetical protein